MKRFIFVLFLYWIIFFQIDATYAQTGNAYYVSPTGLATNPGTLSQPWKTIQKAADTLVAGQTVQINSGTYNEKIIPKNSGTAGNLITYMPFPGAEVTIDGTGIPLTAVSFENGLFQIAGKSYLKIQGLKIINSVYNGINIQPSSGGVRSSNLEITDNTIQNSYKNGIKATRVDQLTITNNFIKHVDLSSGIGVWNATYIVVSHNTIDTPHWYHECQGAYDEGLTISVVNNFEVSYNSLVYTETKPAGYCTGAQRLGIDIKESSQNGIVHHNIVNNFDAGSIYVDGWHAGAGGTPSLNHINIYQNYVQNGGGITVGCEQSDGIVEYVNIYNNLVINAYFSGIQVRGAWGDGLRKNINIYNNTVYGASTLGGNGGAGIYVTTANLQSNNTDSAVIIRNNISNFYFLATGGGSVGQIRAGNSTIAGMVTADHNIVYGPQVCSQDFPNCIELGSRVSASPANLYLDPGTFDLHLKSGSLAIDTGADLTAQEVINDYDSKPRPIGTNFDIGAYEYGEIVPSPSPSIFPTPSPSFTFSDLKNLLINYLNNSDSAYNPVDGKINMLDASWVIKYLE